jgi:outer membrane receptor protein involved in Fe transport
LVVDWVGPVKLLSATPIVQGTALGAGRNKLFIRGVADSSFTGPTQSTTNVYFGDVPVAYNGPDPGLSLYDMDRVEVLEGPQGTLYGAGAIGGIIRLVPHAVDLTRIAAEVSGGSSGTRGGAAGGDIAAMVNVPLVDAALGLRAVAYRVRDGGYIADVARSLRDVNTVTTSGGRLDLRMRPGVGWTIDTGVVRQSVSAPDLQYAERGAPPLSRASLLAQPFDQHYTLGRVVIDKMWGNGLHLVSATGVMRRDADGRFDATRRNRPTVRIAYDTTERSRLFSHETRVSRTSDDGVGWLVGVSFLQARDAYERMYGPPDRLRDIVGVSNRTVDAGDAAADRHAGRPADPPADRWRADRGAAHQRVRPWSRGDAGRSDRRGVMAGRTGHRRLCAYPVRVPHRWHHRGAGHRPRRRPAPGYDPRRGAGHPQGTARRDWRRGVGRRVDRPLAACAGRSGRSHRLSVHHQSGR